MISVLFFCRSNLVFLFAQLGLELQSKTFNVKYLCYSKYELRILKECGISEGNLFLLSDEMSSIKYKTHTDKVLIDEKIRLATGGEFNLNLAIRADRTLNEIGAEESENIVIQLYDFWSVFCQKHNIQYIFHEPCTLSVNFIAACVLRNEMSGEMYSFIQLNGFETAKFAVVKSIDGKFAPFARNVSSDNVTEEVVVRRRVEQHKVLTVIKFILSRFKVKRNVFRSIDPLALRLIEEYKTKERRSLLSVLNKIHGLFLFKGVDSLELNRPFHYFPLHIEPEATVLYWGGYIYSDQISLIERISAILPKGEFLYVKDHPHLLGYRDFRHYKRLRSISNVKLLSVDIPTSTILKKAESVITINGTSGVEALFAGIPVFHFGSIYYQDWPGATRVDGIRSLKEQLVNIENASQLAQMYRLSNIEAYESYANHGFTNFYAGYKEFVEGMNMQRNVKNITAVLENII